MRPLILINGIFLTNEPASHGFISFKISQQPNLPLGSVIPNSAGIYFDFNPPIVTNTTLHMLGENFLETISATKKRDNSDGNTLSVFPNPASEQAMMQLPPTSNTLQVFDQYGHLVYSELVAGQEFVTLPRQSLSPGIYLIRLTDTEGIGLGSTKLVFSR